MFQREVVERISAQVGKLGARFLTVLTGSWASDGEKLLTFRWTHFARAESLERGCPLTPKIDIAIENEHFAESSARVSAKAQNDYE